MRTLLSVFGTRPEAVKMCPLVAELRTRPLFRTLVCVTGQHRDMLRQVLDCFGVTPDYDLAVMQEKQSLTDVTAALLTRLPSVLSSASPDLVLVHGDTVTAFATALACFYRGIPVAHVEAGLRSYDLAEPFPEEFDRRAVTLLSRLHFAPTAQAARNLLREGVPSAAVHVTGNTVLDALRTTVRADFTHPLLDWAGNAPLLLLTAHRREHWGDPLRRILRAVCRVLAAHPTAKFLLPLHPNPVVRAIVQEELPPSPRIRLTGPIPVTDFHNILARTALVLTDSGGLQEEAPALGKPTLVLRDVTERPEGVDAGGLLMVGTEEEDILHATLHLLTDSAAYARMAHAPSPFGDGYACRRIADVLTTYNAPPSGAYWEKKEDCPMIEPDTVRLLRECDAGIKMGTASIDDVLDHVRTPALRNALSDCKGEHEHLQSTVTELLHSYHDEGKDPSLLAKSMSQVKTNVKLGLHESDATIADLMTDGCNMGVKSLARYLNQYAAASEDAKDVARRLIACESHLAEQLRAYL